MSKLNRIITGWSSDRSKYYQEAEEFHKEHHEADSITYDEESGSPICATYWFTPYQVFAEKEKLLARLAEEFKEQN